MTTLDDVWFLADEADQRAERAYHRLRQEYDADVEFSRSETVSRRRFRTLAERISRTGAPYGAHTAVYRESGDLLLVRHDGVDLWVLPGGGVDGDESLREAAARELDEEAGVDVAYEGLAFLTRVDIACADYRTWGVIPVFAARAETHEPTVDDPDDEISAARWFEDPPADTRDRDDLVTWRERQLFD